MSNKRKQYSPEFKAKVAALKSEESTTWKRALLDGAADIFGKRI